VESVVFFCELTARIPSLISLWLGIRAVAKHFIIDLVHDCYSFPSASARSVNEKSAKACGTLNDVFKYSTLTSESLVDPRI
jgi:hypothetical protein